jgi:catechol 2,3-dioxygenase
MGALPAGTHIGSVRLRVADLGRVVAFYRRVLGLATVSEDGGRVVLGARPDGDPLLVLEESTEAPPAPAGSTGLFHFALLLPSRRALAASILAVRDAGWRFQGFADHAVSEAAYLADPEGNGIELYADRPREQWPRTAHGYHMTTDPLDLQDLLSAAVAAGSQIDPGVVMGHVHLRVSSLEEADRFYVGHVGFDAVVRDYPGALFVSANGYHHHLGLNVWGGAGAPAPPEGSRGLLSIDLIVPDADARARITDGASSIADPDGVRIDVLPGSG